MSMNRRAFMGLSLAAGGLAAPSLGADAVPSAARKIKTGFLGLAHSHARGKLRLIRESAAFDLVGVCEPDPGARDGAGAGGLRQFEEAELLSACKVIFVESAVRDHARQAAAALRAGCHVHVEKPPASNLADMAELVGLARSRKRLLQVGYMWRHNPGTRALESLVERRVLGDVFLFRATMNSLVGGGDRPEWGEFKGGAMFELGGHLIDIAVRLLGTPARVTPFLGSHGAQGDAVHDNTAAILEYPKAQAIITCAMLHPNGGKHRFVEILGSNGSARIQPIEQPVLHLDLAQPAGGHPAGPSTLEFAPYRRYEGEIAELARAVARGDSELPPTLEVEAAIQATLLQASGMA